MVNSAEVFPPGFRVVNSAGQPVSGAQIRFFAAGTTTPLTVYADKNLTQSLGPIVYTRSDGYPVGNQGSQAAVLVYLGSAPYKIDILDANGVNIFPTQDNVQGALGISATVSLSQGINLAALQAASTPFPTTAAGVFITQAYAIDGDGGGGVFAWSGANHATDVTNDPKHGVFAPPNSDTTGASGAWVRQYSGPVQTAWFGGMTRNTNTNVVKAANTASIQAAIDFAYANLFKDIKVPDGVFWCNPGIYLDAPGNLRSTPSAPTIFNFSLSLEGGGNDASNNFGTTLKFSDNTQVTLAVGTGQRMRVSKMSIEGPGGATSRAALPINGVGIGLAGGSGGLSGCLLSEVTVINFRAGVMSGYNGVNALCDSVTLFKCDITSCYYGWYISQTQNYIDSAISCHMADNTVHIYSPVGKAVSVYGGNYSGTVSHSNTFTIGSTTGLSTLADTYIGSSLNNWTFSTTLSSDDQPIRDGAYDRFCLNLAHYGLVPLVLQSYNTSTRVATFKFYGGWLAGIWNQLNFGLSGGVDLLNNTDIATEIGSATSLYAAESETCFFGTGFHVYTAHLELPFICSRPFDGRASFGGDTGSFFRGCFFNYSLSGASSSTPVFYNQIAFPAFYVAQCNFAIEDCTVDGNTGGSVGTNIEVVQSFRFTSARCDWNSPTMICALPPSGSDGQRARWVAYSGVGDWDGSPQVMGSRQWYLPSQILGGGGFDGWYPKANSTARVNAADLASWIAPGTVGNYPPMMGQMTYMTGDWEQIVQVASGTASTGESPRAANWLSSSHLGFSWGQNLPSNTWNYKGGSMIVNVTSTANLFPGLHVLLNNGGGDQLMVITGVYQSPLNYITVRPVTGATVLNGTVGTVYTASLIKSQPFAFNCIPGWPALKAVSNTASTSVSASAGDMSGGDTVVTTFPNIGANNYTTRSATQMAADCNGIVPGMSWLWQVVNTSGGTMTVVAGSGVTISGTATIATATVRVYQIAFPTATTMTVTSVGSFST